MVFPQVSVLGAKPGRNPILLMACLLGKIDFTNTIGRAFHGGLPNKIVTKTQNLTRLWPKAKISSFSEWTVVHGKRQKLVTIEVCLATT